MLIGSHELTRLCRARALLRAEADADAAPTIAAVARAVAMSPFHFTRRFAAVFGATPHQVRIAARLERARHLLARGDHSVTEVCMAVGFTSLGSFSALFTRRVGETPSAYRRSRRALVQVPGTLPPAVIPGCLRLMGQLPADAFRRFREA